MTRLSFFNETEKNKKLFITPHEVITLEKFKEDIKNSLNQIQVEEESTYYAVNTDNHYLALVDIFSLWELKKTPILTREDQVLPQSVKNIEKKGTVLHNRELSFHYSHEQISVGLQTSGSTGGPKICLHTFESLYYSFLGSSEFYNFKQNDLFACSLPLNHAGGFMLAMRSLLSKGIAYLDFHWTDLLQKDFDYISFVPTQLLNAIKEQKIEKLKKSKAILLGGAATSKALFQKATELSLPISLTYGLTETLSQVTATKAGEKASLHSGEVLPYRSITINLEGLIVIGGKTLLKKYMSTNSNISSLITNDTGEIKDNKLYVKSRIDNIFISGGKNISAEEVEEIVRDNFNVSDVFLIPVKDETWGEVGVLFSDISIDQEKLNRQLPSYKRPKAYFKLPPKEGLKYSRKKLKELAQKEYDNSL